MRRGPSGDRACGASPASSGDDRDICLTMLPSAEGDWLSEPPKDPDVLSEQSKSFERCLFGARSTLAMPSREDGSTRAPAPRQNRLPLEDTIWNSETIQPKGPDGVNVTMCDLNVRDDPDEYILTEVKQKTPQEMDYENYLFHTIRTTPLSEILAAMALNKRCKESATSPSSVVTQAPSSSEQYSSKSRITTPTDRTTMHENQKWRAGDSVIRPYTMFGTEQPTRLANTLCRAEDIITDLLERCVNKIEKAAAEDGATTEVVEAVSRLCDALQKIENLKTHLTSTSLAGFNSSVLPTRDPPPQ